MNQQRILRVVSLLILWAIFSNNLYADEWDHLANGSKLQKAGRYQEAVAEYRKAIEINPNIIEVYGNIGFIYQYFMSEYKKAKDSYLEGLERAPDDFSLNMNLMYLYFKMDNNKSGTMIYENLSTINKNNISYTFPKEILEKLFFGLSANEKVDFCRKYLGINPTDQILRNVLADLLFEKKSYADARKEYISILKQQKESESSSIYFKLGVCEYYLSDFDAALNNLEKAESLGQHVPKAYLYMIEKEIIEDTTKGK